MLKVLAKTAERRFGDFKTRELANIAWAIGMVKRPEEKLFIDWARVVERRVSQFNAQDVTRVAWSFATL